MNKLFDNIAPFLGLGILIVLFILGIFIFSYLLIIGAIVGLVLYIVALIRAKFGSSKSQQPPHSNLPEGSGRVIDQEK